MFEVTLATALGSVLPIFKFEQQAVLFIHIPKAGGSTVEDYLRGYAPRALFSADNATRKAVGFPCSPQHLHGAALRYLLGPGFVDWSFTVVRDPLARLVSEYRWRHRRRAYAEERLPSIEDWFAKACERYAVDPYVMDNHLRPQHEFVLKDTEVYRLEDGLAVLLSALGKRLNLGSPKKEDGHHRNRSPRLPVDVTPALERAVREFYAADYERFGY